MKKLFYLALAAFACSCAGGSYVVTGEVEGVNAGDSVMIFSYFDKDTRYAETVVGEDGTFTLEGKVSQPEVAAVVLNGRNLISLLFLEKGTMSVVNNEQGTVDVNGSKFNDAMSRFKYESWVLEQKFSSVDPSLSEEEKTAYLDSIYDEYVEFVSTTVDANLDNIFGAYIFATQEFNTLEAADAQAHIAAFSPKLLENEFMAEIAESVENMAKTAVGQPYIDITLSNVEGEAKSVSELLAQGKYVLIDFWATWCGPCMNEMPHLKEAYAEFRPKGFEIYGVSLDRNDEDWRSVVDSTMPWVNVINTADSPATTDYSVRTIPSNFLISPDGVIVAKDLRGEEVATILSEQIK